MGLPLRRHDGRLLIATHYWYPRGAALSRYDFLSFCLGIQVAMLLFRLETLEEAKVILLFHVVGTIMEIFKTSVGSWIYPEDAFFPRRRGAHVLGLHVCVDRQLHRAVVATV